MRRSILIVMLDVMVLSVLALTAGQRAGGSNINIPIPLYRWSAMIEEGLRKETDFLKQVEMLEAQLAEASDIARKALAQAEKSQDDAGRERAGNREMQTKLRQAELDAERERSKAALASREAEIAAEKTAQMEQRTLELERRTVEMERRETEARNRADAAISKARAAEADALDAERRALAVATVSESLQKEIAQVSALQRTTEASAEETSQKLQLLQHQLESRNEELQAAQVAESAARERALATVGERERLIEKSDVAAEDLVLLREKMAVLEVQKESETEKVAQLEEVQRKEEEERSKSVWVRRDEALRHLSISYTEYNASNERSFTTHRRLTMPIVMVGTRALIPGDFRKLGLNSSFWSGLSEFVTEVSGTLSPVAGQTGSPLPIRSIIVPGLEPQVCFVHFEGSVEGAINSISMAALKEQRLKNALLFSPDNADEHGRVEVVPVVGRDYLKVRHSSGKKPKVGDYLLSERGEFIGVMVTKEDCYVTPQSLARVPAPVVIPFTDKRENEAYLNSFVRALKGARSRVKSHLSKRDL